MKRWICSSIALAALMATLMLGVAVPAAPSSHPQPAASPAPPEPHPEIREAIGALRRAREHMQHAAHDFGGHRVQALRATDDAIRQLQDCLKYDN